MDTRYLQAHREARWALALSLMYMLGWAVSAYLPGEAPGITGLPVWFELSCLLVPLLFIVLCWLIIHLFFREISLESTHED
ncbi:MAG: YhdT family protein [Enterobacteriaceae bacterium]